MNKQEILSFLKNGNFHTTKILKQHWRENKYSYHNAPRPDYGLLLVLKGNVDFRTGDEVLSVSAGSVVFLPQGSEYEAGFLDEADG